MSKRDEMTVMKYDRNGGTDVLTAQTRPLPVPGPEEALVEVIAAGVNHIDGFIRSGRETAWADEPFPRGSGSDFAGIVVTADAAGRFKRGEEVIGHVRQGAHATHIVVPVAALVRKPPHVAWEVAGGLFLAGVTALDTLDDLRIGPDDTVVISAAAGGVGSIEAQLAKHRGARVIGTCGERNFDYLRQLGIRPVTYGEGIAERIRAFAPLGVTALIDNFGQDGRALADELGVPASRYRSSEDRRDTELRLLQDDPASIAHATAQLERVARLADERAFTLLISGYYPLDDIATAYDDLKNLHSRGKIVLGTHPVTTYRTLKARDVHEARD
ncbi:NADP-dependent oxidoreductase [Leifsonia sp. F6_8S_P_1B]|uniref:NADP-dependent oxidoreductase n=1 Tax=Leifsonia williamsii TaxID=3035919 RepID=A0ABT8K6Y3_9MICO|nr:NADP-dependent oxidoreductase [Leifsonia williamsii]MDN4613210.1 NADP-dependent oxidoreductase [Leifsonia williamsii]